jgi:hypothetical protein
MLMTVVIKLANTPAPVLYFSVYLCSQIKNIHTVDQLLASEKFFGTWPRPISTFVCGFVQAKIKTVVNTQPLPL